MKIWNPDTDTYEESPTEPFATEDYVDAEVAGAVSGPTAGMFYSTQLCYFR